MMDTAAVAYNRGSALLPKQDKGVRNNGSNQRKKAVGRPV